MTTQIEPAGHSLDFPEMPCLKITAFEPADLFKLGRQSCQLEEHKVKFVTGITADGRGQYLRLPLVITK